MDFKVKLQSTKINELKAEIEKVETLLHELKIVLDNFSEASFEVHLSPIINGKDLLLAVNKANKRVAQLL
jgi:hypothetical protein